MQEFLKLIFELWLLFHDLYFFFLKNLTFSFNNVNVLKSLMWLMKLKNIGLSLQLHWALHLFLIFFNWKCTHNTPMFFYDEL